MWSETDTNLYKVALNMNEKKKCPSVGSNIKCGYITGWRDVTARRRGQQKQTEEWREFQKWLSVGCGVLVIVASQFALARRNTALRVRQSNTHLLHIVLALQWRAPYRRREEGRRGRKVQQSHLTFTMSQSTWQTCFHNILWIRT